MEQADAEVGQEGFRGLAYGDALVWRESDVVYCLVEGFVEVFGVVVEFWGVEEKTWGSHLLLLSRRF